MMSIARAVTKVSHLFVLLNFSEYVLFRLQTINIDPTKFGAIAAR